MTDSHHITSLEDDNSSFKVYRRPQLEWEAPQEKAVPGQAVAFGNQVVST